MQYALQMELCLLQDMPRRIMLRNTYLRPELTVVFLCFFPKKVRFQWRNYVQIFPPASIKISGKEKLVLSPIVGKCNTITLTWRNPISGAPSSETTDEPTVSF
jgi:hypothetical protein